MSLRPKISVCMASFNGASFIETQISSVLLQLSTNDELIISDNGSTDETLTIVDNFQDRRIKLIHSGNLGPVANFENALLAAEGDYIVLCDQDDVWLPGRLSAATSALQGADLSIVGLTPTDDMLNPLGIPVPIPKLNILSVLVSNGYVGCAMAFRKNVKEACLPFPRGIPMHDWWIAAVSLLKFRVVIDPTKYILYRRHEANLTSIETRWRASIRVKIKWRISLLTALFNRFWSR